MNKEAILKLLKSEPLTFTYDEIQQIMDAELEKDPSEMDTDLVDLCADVLMKALESSKETEESKENKENNKPKNKKHTKIKIVKIISIAAAVAVILGTAVTVFAKYVDSDISDEIVQFYDNHFSFNLKNGKRNANQYSSANKELVKTLQANGFKNIILPDVLLSKEYTYEYKVTEDDAFVTATVTFNRVNDNTIISAAITKYKNGIDDKLENITHLSEVYDTAKQITLIGMDIFVFSNNEMAEIIYIDKDVEYELYLNTNLETAIEIANTLAGE